MVVVSDVKQQQEKTVAVWKHTAVAAAVAAGEGIGGVVDVVVEDAKLVVGKDVMREFVDVVPEGCLGVFEVEVGCSKMGLKASLTQVESLR